MEVARDTFQDIGLVVDRTNQKKGVIVAKGFGPRPLSKSEWENIKPQEIEEMRAIIEDEHGKLIANSFSVGLENDQIFMGVRIKTKKMES
jgi:hypothetical protein